MGGASRLLSSRTEPDFVEPIGLGQGMRFQRVITRQHPVFTPVRGSLFVGRTGERIISEGFSIGVKFPDGSISPVCQDELRLGESDIFRLGAHPQGNDSEIARRNTSLVRAGQDGSHYAVQIQKVIPFSRMTI
jgi:hypothetical protein